IAVPNFIKARTNSRLQTVVANLKQIDGAKEQWAMENGKKAGDACTGNTDLYPTYMKSWPDNTPVTGAYLANAVGANPTFIGSDSDTWKTNCSGGGGGCNL